MILSTLFSQRDVRWAAHRIGRSIWTLGGKGCLTSCYAIILRFIGRKTDPAMVNRLLTNNNGYTPDGRMYLGALPRLYGYWQEVVDCQKRPATEAEIKRLREYVADRPAIIQVDMNPNTAAQDMHFVVVYGTRGDDFLIADPWPRPGDAKQLTTLQDTYFGVHNMTTKKAIYRIIYFWPTKDLPEKKCAHCCPIHCSR